MISLTIWTPEESEEKKNENFISDAAFFLSKCLFNMFGMVFMRFSVLRIWSYHNEQRTRD